MDFGLLGLYELDRRIIVSVGSLALPIYIYIYIHIYIHLSVPILYHTTHLYIYIYMFVDLCIDSYICCCCFSGFGVRPRVDPWLRGGFGFGAWGLCLGVFENRGTLIN